MSRKKLHQKNKKICLSTIDEFINIVKKCAHSCNEDLCLQEDTIKMFSSFDFTPDDAVEFWAALKPMVEKIHGNAENYYSNSYGLLQENLPPKKFGGDITLTNILLPEVDNHILMHLSTKKVHFDNPTIKNDSVKLSERELKSLQYIIVSVVHQLYSKFKFSKNKDCVYSKQCVSILLCCKIDSDDTQTLMHYVKNVKIRSFFWSKYRKIQIRKYSVF